MIEQQDLKWHMAVQNLERNPRVPLQNAGEISTNISCVTGELARPLRI